MEHTGKIYGDGALPVLLGNGAEFHFRADARVGDHNIGRTGLAEGAVEGSAVGDIHLVSGASQLLAGRDGMLAFQIENSQARASQRQRAGSGRPYTVRPAGDYGDLTREI